MINVKEGVSMATIPRTKENLFKCLCRKCPSYNFTCKVKAIPGNVILIASDMENKVHAETMFCAYEKSSCIDEENGCICVDCPLYTEYQLNKTYFCIETGGK